MGERILRIGQYRRSPVSTPFKAQKLSIPKKLQPLSNDTQEVASSPLRSGIRLNAAKL
jgi:hypothetical protein